MRDEPKVACIRNEGSGEMIRCFDRVASLRPDVAAFHALLALAY
jgi:hypothetical protein